jgi:hypothetical protein
MRVLNPPNHPAGIDFCADPPEARANLWNILVSLDEVATGAADLLKQPLTLGKKRRIFKRLNIYMT